MKINELDHIKEDLNTHLTHLEDLSLFKGKPGAADAIQTLNSLADMLKGHSNKKINITTKWDGSPAIICGTDPKDGEFFVGTKGVFNKNPKLNKSIDDVETNHADQKQGDELKDKSGLRAKLKLAYEHLKKLNIKGVLQGDLMFTQGDIQTKSFEGKSYITFKPQLLTYAVPSDSDLAKKMMSAKVGIVFHTKYEGESLEDMNASFNIDLSDLTPTPDVWFDDAYIKDVSGMVNFTEQEYKQIKTSIEQANTYYKSIGNAFQFLDSTEAGKNLKDIIAANMNNNIKQGVIEQDPTKFYNSFVEDYKRRANDAIAKLKTGPEGPAGQRKLAALEQGLQFLDTNNQNLQSFYSMWLKLGAIKNAIYQKIRNIKAIDTFDEVDGELKVSDPEGFVAVDRIGNAVKIVDRLDFSRKNFNKEDLELNLNLLNDLSESRQFRNRKSVSKYSAKGAADLAFAELCALVILNYEYKYANIASRYAYRTASYGNFDYFRNNGTDLYILLHALAGTGSVIRFADEENSKVFQKRLQINTVYLKEFLNYIVSNGVNQRSLSRYLMRVSRMLMIDDSSLRAIRRLTADFPILKSREKAMVVVRTMQYLRSASPRSELLIHLQQMSRERRLEDKVKDQQKMSPAVAVGAALIGGYAGYKLVRDKKWQQKVDFKTRNLKS